MSAQGLLHALLSRSQSLVLWYFLALNLLYLVLFLFSILAILHHLRRMSYRSIFDSLKSRRTPPVSVLIPAYDEAATIVSSVRSICQLNYPEIEIIVVNDGSKDDTLARLVEAFDMRRTERVYHQTLTTKPVRAIYSSRLAAPWAELVVVDKENGGKADALNAGINVSRYPFFCSIDADSLLERDALLRVILPFLERSDVAGVGGLVRIANGCDISDGVVRRIGAPRSWLARMQTVEYLRAFLSGRVAWSDFKALLIISGAFSLFKKGPVLEVGGYSADTVGEDMELVLRLHHVLRGRGRACDITFIPDPVCWTEAPERWRMLWRQRNRWHRGLSQSLCRHAGMLLNPRFGAIGLLAAPYFWSVEFLGPVVEVLGYLAIAVALALGALDWRFVASFFLLTVAMGVNFSLLAVLLDEFTMHRYTRVRDLLRLLAGASLEHLGYRQVTALARLQGLWDFLRNRNAWGFIERKGLDHAA